MEIVVKTVKTMLIYQKLTLHEKRNRYLSQLPSLSYFT